MATSRESPTDFVEVGFSDVADANSHQNNKSPDEILDPQDEKAFQDARISIPMEEGRPSPNDGPNVSDTLSESQPQTSPPTTSTNTSASATQPPSNNKLSESASEFGRRVFNRMASAVPDTQTHDRPSAAESRTFFSNREGVFENAVEDFKKHHLKVEEDGDIRGAWLLTQIDHWDMEKERLVVITDNWLIVVKYDFISLQVPEIMKIPLRGVDQIVMGEFQYPNKSLMAKRASRGVRAMWNCHQPVSFVHNWNPWSRQIPWLSLTSHPMYWHHDRDQNTYDVDSFGEALCQAVEQDKHKYSLEPAKISRSPIVVENYAGLASIIHNIAGLGFYKVRGKVSF